MRWLVRQVLAFAGVAAFVGATAASAKPPKFCRQTTRHSTDSCEAGVKSDYLLALANCDNLSDPDERRTCREEAIAARQEGENTCDEQEAVREAACEALGAEPYDPVIDASNFVDTIDNPLFPLTPGTTFIYDGQAAEGPEHRVLIVTHNTREILGVQCVEVHDIVKINNELEEDTLDWFAQDADGNVWYFGENSKQVADGLIVGLEGSWTAGVDGAKPGIIMEAQNAVGDFYRQEFALDTAEDLAEVQSVAESVTVPFGSFSGCLKTLETTPLNVDDISNKFYCPGIGEVMTQDQPPGGETLQLVKITTE